MREEQHIAVIITAVLILFVNSTNVIAQENIPNSSPGDPIFQGLAVSTDSVTIPLYDQSAEIHSLQITLKQTTFGEDASFEVSELDEKLTSGNYDDPIVLVLSYLNAIRVGRMEDLNQLLAPDTDMPKALQMAAMYEHSLKGKENIDVVRFRLDRAWYFGPYQIFAVWLEFSNGFKTLNTVSVEWSDKRYYRQDDWGTGQNIQTLFWYMAGHLSKGKGREHHPVDLEHSITLGSDETAIELAFEGILYGSDKEALQEISRRSPTDGAPKNIVEFVGEAIAVAQSGEDQEVLALFSDQDRQAANGYKKFVENGASEDITEEENDSVRAGVARGALGTASEIRSVITMRLGDYSLHYFTDHSEPSTLQSVFIDTSDNIYKLTGIFQGNDIPLNIYQLLTSEVFKQALAQRYLNVSDAPEEPPGDSG